MKYTAILETKANLIIASKIKIADNFFSRLRGLMFRRFMSDNEGLLLTKTKQVHTFWMRFAIDIIYLQKIDKENYLVIFFEENLQPWKIGKYQATATDILELKQGIIKDKQIKIGDQLKKDSEIISKLSYNCIK